LVINVGAIHIVLSVLAQFVKQHLPRLLIEA